jgi:transposase
MSTDASLPNDLLACQRELLACREDLSRKNCDLNHVQSILAETAVVCEEQKGEIEKLQAELELFKRYIFGRRSERMTDSPGQGRLFQEPSEGEGPSPPAEEAGQEEITYRRRRRGHGWSKLPEHLPREEVLVDVPEEERTCPDCGEPLEKIGEDRSERVELVPAKLVVKVIVRPKYACKKKHGIQQRPAPPSPVPGGRFDFGFVAHVLASKFADHLPHYRQQDILARSGLELSRSTLCDIAAGASRLLAPLAELLRQRVIASGLAGADDTPVRLLDPQHPDGVRTARFWLYRGFEAAPYDVFDFHESRSRDGPAEFLKGFRGWVKVDAYGVNEGVYLGSDSILASCCWSHARRKFFEAKSSHPSASAYALGLIRELYDIEDRARDWSAADRLALRQSEALPVLARLRTWLDEQRPSVLPKSKLGEAIRYALNQWDELLTYTTDGRLPIDNNDTERDLRMLTIGRKNWLFLGAPEAGPRAAILYTIVASAARHRLDVWAYLVDVMRRLAEGADDLAAMLPDTWAATHPASVRTYRHREREQRAAAKRACRLRRRALAATR